MIDSPNVQTKKIPTSRSMGRRSFVKLIPAVGAAGMTAEANINVAPVQSAAQQPVLQQKVTKEALHCAEQLIGIELTDAQETMALPGVNRNLTNYENLRKIEIPLDTEPAFSFRPGLPGKKYGSGPALMKLGKPEMPAFRLPEDLAFCTVTQLAELVRAKRVSPVELTKMYLERLRRYSARLNCVVTFTEELAMAQAEDAERELRLGKYRGPLHGIPWGAKDLFATRNILTTWGAEPYRQQVFPYDATVVERLRKAGAVLIAKLSMGALAQGGRWFGGMTRNPWNVEESNVGSSGSSAGSASATSAGLVGFSLGTETLGSIVSPCSRCGVVGLRPTYGRISRYGAMGLSWTMDKIGPICRGVEDCALVLNAIYGPDGRDLTVGNVPFRFEAEQPLARLRIAYLKTEFDQAKDDQKSVYTEALQALRAAGAKLEPAELPKFSTGSLRFILSAEAAAAFDDITRDGRINELSGQSPGDWPNTFRTSRFVPAVEYVRAQRARFLLMNAMDEFMSARDVFVSPAPGSASLLMTNLTGHPAIVMPCGFVKGQPQAIMFTGALYSEGAPLRVALAFERATQWHTMHPKEFAVNP
jgi:Asp-tRNA(Asn)/Glu-tRNA(Gln) amidotransferase A subunit family amidase